MKTSCVYISQIRKRKDIGFSKMALSKAKRIRIIFDRLEFRVAEFSERKPRSAHREASDKREAREASQSESSAEATVTSHRTRSCLPAILRIIQWRDAPTCSRKDVCRIGRLCSILRARFHPLLLLSRPRSILILFCPFAPEFAFAFVFAFGIAACKSARCSRRSCASHPSREPPRVFIAVSYIPEFS